MAPVRRTARPVETQRGSPLRPAQRQWLPKNSRQVIVTPPAMWKIWPRPASTPAASIVPSSRSSMYTGLKMPLPLAGSVIIPARHICSGTTIHAREPGP